MSEQGSDAPERRPAAAIERRWMDMVRAGAHGFSTVSVLNESV